MDHDNKESETSGGEEEEVPKSPSKPKSSLPRQKTPKVKSDENIEPEKDPYSPAPVITQPIADKYSNQPMNPVVSGTEQNVQSQKDYSPDPMKKPLASSTPLKKASKSKVPAGLDLLLNLDYLFIKQKVSILETLTSFEMNNKYVIRNRAGEDLFFAVEDTDCLTRTICSHNRPFDIKILDVDTKKEVIHIQRALRCGSTLGCCFPCCLHKVSVECPPGKLIGTINQKCSFCLPKFLINNSDGDTVLQIEGPFCQVSCFCRDVDFKILSKTGETEVGKISKHWSGLAREAFTDADNFGIQFPVDLDEKCKAVMLGAAFLIDFMFFEDKQ